MPSPTRFRESALALIGSSLSLSPFGRQSLSIPPSLFPFCRRPWPELRTLLIAKLHHNVDAYLASSTVFTVGESSDQQSTAMAIEPSSSSADPSTAATTATGSEEGGDTNIEMQDKEAASGTGPTDVIGGRKLAGRMTADDARELERRVTKLLHEFEECVLPSHTSPGDQLTIFVPSSPPFTIQRLTEVLLDPRTFHSTVGKHLRALERILLVTSSWSPPSPPIGLLTSGSAATALDMSLDPSTTTSSSGSSAPRYVNTPLFSPIPFLVREEEETNRPLMSPLMLGTPMAGAISPMGSEGGLGGDEDGDEDDQQRARNLFMAARPPHLPDPVVVDDMDSGPHYDDSAVALELDTAEGATRATTMTGQLATSPSITTSTDEAPPLLTNELRVDELDAGPIPGAAAGDAAASSSLAAETGELSPRPSQQQQQPHLLSPHPTALSSTSSFLDTTEHSSVPTTSRYDDDGAASPPIERRVRARPSLDDLGVGRGGGAAESDVAGASAPSSLSSSSSSSGAKMDVAEEDRRRRSQSPTPDPRKVQEELRTDDNENAAAGGAGA